MPLSTKQFRLAGLGPNPIKTECLRQTLSNLESPDESHCDRCSPFIPRYRGEFCCDRTWKCCRKQSKAPTEARLCERSGPIRLDYRSSTDRQRHVRASSE